MLPTVKTLTIIGILWLVLLAPKGTLHGTGCGPGIFEIGARAKSDKAFRSLMA